MATMTNNELQLAIKLERATDAMAALAAAINAQTQAINSLAASNELLANTVMEAIADNGEVEDDSPMQFASLDQRTPKVQDMSQR